MSEKVQLTVSGIQEDLNSGLTRAQIQEKYGLTNRDLKSVFTHPKLKGLKTKPAPQFELTDDTEDTVESATEEVTAEQEMQPPSIDNDFNTNTPVETITDEF